MVDNRLALITPDVDEAVVIPKAPRKRRGSEEKEQEIINAILAGIAAHDRDRENLEKETSRSRSGYDPAHELPDYMEVAPKLFDDDDDLTSYMFKKEEAEQEDDIDEFVEDESNDTDKK